MSEETKPKPESPSFIGHEAVPQPRVETGEPIEEGVIVEQPITPAEQQAIEEELQHQAVVAGEPALEQIPVVEQPLPVTANIETIDAPHVEKHLTADNQLNNSGDAYDMLNDILKGNFKP